jgi:isocitrate dehydrogenase (NAD+)
LALKGPLTTPVGGGFKSINVTLRQEFELFANLRPARTLIPGGRFENIDIVLVRENLEGFYAAMEHYMPIGHDPKAIAMSTGFNTRTECRRIVEYAFDYAVKNGRKRVTVVHKANILKALTGLFLEEGRKVAELYAGRIEMNDRIVDACAMQLVLDPWQYDVIVTTNLFGDILSDLIAGLVGGLGMAPGANIGADAAIFEAVHGSAPDIANKGIANPLAMLLSTGLMLQHVGREDLANRLTAGIDAVIASGARTRDIGGTRSCARRPNAALRSRSARATWPGPMVRTGSG